MMEEPLISSDEPSQQPRRQSLRLRKILAFGLTYLSYTCFHLSRKPASILKSVLHPTHDYDPETNPGWAPFNRDVVPQLVATEGYVVRNADLYSGSYNCEQFTVNDTCLVFREKHGLNASIYLTGPDLEEKNGLCANSWVIVPNSEEEARERGELNYYAQEYDGREIPAATVGHRGQWDQCKLGTCDCTEDSSISVSPDTLSGNILLGEVDTVFLGFYSFGLFVSGHFGDYLNLRHFLVFGMVGSGVCSIALGLAHSLGIHSMAYFLFWNGLGGLFQSIGWPCVVAIMSHWFGKETRGFVMGVWSSHASIGNILGSVITSASLSMGMYGRDWPLGFILPGLIIVCMAVIVFFLLDEEPPASVEQEDTLSLVENAHEGAVEEPLVGGVEGDQSEDESVGFMRALMIPGVITYSICLAFCKLTVYSLMYWGPFYLAHVGFTAENAGFMSSFYDIGGVVGGIVAGYVSDKLQLRATVAFGFLLLSVPSIWFYYVITAAAGPNVGVNIVVMIVVGAIVSAPYTLITTAVSADLGTHPSLKGNSQLFASVSGIIDGTGSIGAMVQGVLIGYISTSSWKNVYQFLLLSNAVAAILLIRATLVEMRTVRT